MPAITDIKMIQDEEGNLPQWAWPGGHPIFYLAQDGGVLCAKCANENKELSGDEFDPQWNIVAFDINDNDEPIVCAHCNEKIPSTCGEVKL